MAAIKRRQYFVDRSVQGALLVRAIMYWMFCLLTLTLMLLCWRIVTGPVQSFSGHLEQLWLHYAPAVMASLLLLPIVLIDCVRTSNRFAGPVFRLRRAMKELAQGRPVEAVFFRNDDFWQEFADDFNRLLPVVKREPYFPAETEETSQEDVQVTSCTAG